jgi:hypothetical protein
VALGMIASGIKMPARGGRLSIQSWMNSVGRC